MAKHLTGVYKARTQLAAQEEKAYEVSEVSTLACSLNKCSIHYECV